MKDIVDLSFDETWERLFERGVERGRKPTHAGITANLCGLDLSGADLSGALLTSAVLIGANLNDAMLRGAALNGAYLSDASFRCASMEYMKAIGANFVGADLSGAGMYHATVAGSDFRLAKLDWTDVRGVDFSNVAGVFSFYAGRHAGVYVIGSNSVTIGCQTRTIADWLERGSLLGKKERYSQEDIKSYMRVIRMIDGWDKEEDR